MKDTLLHIALLIGGALVTWGTLGVLPDLQASILLSTFWAVYWREVIQRQTGKDLGFTQGWLPWNWYSSDGSLNVQKVIETVIPVAFGILATGVTWVI